jgi:hypothetical protein
MKKTICSVGWLKGLLLTSVLLGASPAWALDIIPTDPSRYCIDTNGYLIPVHITPDCESAEEPIVTGAIRDAFIDGVWHGHFVPNHAGTFSICAWSECEQVAKGVTITVVEVAGTTVVGGTEIDDEDDDPNTATYVLDCESVEDAQVVVYGISNPSLSESALPTCWSATGGGGGASRSYRTVNALQTGTTTITFTAGTSHKSVTVIVSSPCGD